MKNVFKIRFMNFVAVFAAVMIVAGCSSTPLRTDATTSGIRAAEEAGAANVPQAQLHLQLARDELAQAKMLSEKGEKDKAASMLLRSEADAELALVLARGDAEKTQANEAVERVRKLRQDNP